MYMKLDAHFLTFTSFGVCVETKDGQLNCGQIFIMLSFVFFTAISVYNCVMQCNHYIIIM